MVDIVKVFEDVLSRARSIDMAESEFKCLLCDDPELRASYKEWCAEEDTTEKLGFVEYCEMRFDEEETLWDALNDDDYE